MKPEDAFERSFRGLETSRTKREREEAETSKKRAVRDRQLQVLQSIEKAETFAFGKNLKEFASFEEYERAFIHEWTPYWLEAARTVREIVGTKILKKLRLPKGPSFRIAAALFEVAVKPNPDPEIFSQKLYDSYLRLKVKKEWEWSGIPPGESQTGLRDFFLILKNQLEEKFDPSPPKQKLGKDENKTENVGHPKTVSTSSKAPEITESKRIQRSRPPLPKGWIYLIDAYEKYKVPRSSAHRFYKDLPEGSWRSEEESNRICVHEKSLVKLLKRKGKI